MVANEWAERVVREARVATMRPAPDRAWQAIERRILNGDEVLLPERVVGPRAARLWSAGALRAAVVVLVVAGGAAALVPGTGVRQWLERALHGPAVDAPTETVPRPEAPTAPEPVRVIIPADGQPLHVILEQPSPNLHVRVRVGPPGALEVTATGGAATGRFRRGLNRLTIAGAGAGEVLLVLPGGDQPVRVEVDGRPLVRRDGGNLVVLTPAFDSVGSELILRVGPAGAPRPTERP